MHYQSLVKGLANRLILLLLILGWIQAMAQNAPPAQLPVPAAQDPASPKPNPSQPVSQQAVDFYRQAKSAGMSDTDIHRAAMQRGYTPDQISTMRRPAPLQVDDDRIDANREQLDETRSQQEQDELDDEANNQKDSTSMRRASYRRQSRTFGSAFFARAASTFEPNLRIATPRNYILGPEDEIVVDVYGNAVDNFRMKISPEGTVKMLNLAPVYVNGLTVEQASQRIVARLREAYSTLNRPGSGTYSSITLGNVRSIRVMITGEAARPGTYTVSSLATAFNALSMSGGPSYNGSYRNIEVIRNNSVVKKIDLYRFLVDADLRDNIALQDQDIILIHPFETRIELNGQLKRPGIFEVKPGEALGSLIRYAAGFTPEAYTKTLNYQRNTGVNYVIGSIDSAQVDSFVPQNGDIFNVKRILDVVINQVEIRGAVTVPGPYALEQRCNTVLKLIKTAQGTSPRAFLNRAILERSSGQTQIGIVAIDLRKLINGEIEDIPLLAGDILTIKSIEDLKEFTFLTISGSVINPGSYYYYKDITIADLIFQAGGYTEGGIPYRIEVSRRVKNDTLDLPGNQNVRIFKIDVADNLVLNPDDQKFKLQPQDIIIVRKSPRYEAQKAIAVLGEVKYPGNYTIISNFERISDILEKVGGLKPEAYLPGARFYRGSELIAVDIKAIIDKPSLASNLLLISGDTLVIPRRSETVRIQGGVHNPSVMNFDAKFRYADYISQAGGYTEQGWKKRVFVSYPNGRTFRTRNFLFFRSYPKVEPGAVVTIPNKQVQAPGQRTPGERVALFSFISSMLGTITLAAISLSRSN